jgi:apolipoprotein N-acyltransferase
MFRPPLSRFASLGSAGLALVAGLLQAGALADPWWHAPHGWLQMASLAVLAGLLALSGATWRRGFVLAWLFGLAWLTGTCWWLFISMHRYGGLDAVLAVLAVLALAGALALYYGVAGALFAWLTGRRGRAGFFTALTSATLFAALWTLAELARGQWFTGFPWGAGGYAHVGPAYVGLDAGLDTGRAFVLDLTGYAPYIGVYGLGFVAAWVAACLGVLVAMAFTGRLARRPWRADGRDGGRGTPKHPWAGFVVAIAVAYFLLWLPDWLPAPDRDDGPRPPMTVALLQGNIPQDVKFVPGEGIDLSLIWYGRQIRQTTATLTIAPETAIPLLPDDLPPGYWDALTARFATGGQALLTGIPLGSLQTAGYTNSATAFAPDAQPRYRYDKHHLVPFGEFIPPLFKWFVRLMNIPLGDFSRGPLVQPSFAWRGERLAPTICYEDLFGEELAARFADPASAPTALVNISNLGWFGNTVALDQHLAISRMRALEFARPMLRATNTGATAIIDARGRVTQELPYATRGVLTGQFHGATRITPYARWAARWGLRPLWGLCLIIVAAAWLLGWRSERDSTPHA